MSYLVAVLWDEAYCEGSVTDTPIKEKQERKGKKERKGLLKERSRMLRSRREEKR